MRAGESNFSISYKRLGVFAKLATTYLFGGRDLWSGIYSRGAYRRRCIAAHVGYGAGDCNGIGDIDTLIAATALERDLTAVTTDSDLERVPQLKFMLITLRA